jgi:hypothetical protein
MVRIRFPPAVSHVRTRADVQALIVIPDMHEFSAVKSVPP